MQMTTKPLGLLVPGRLVCACFLAGCGSRANVQCVQDGNCNLSTGGLCVSAPTGNRWCAYPDLACPSGLRYSNEDVGDDVGGTCTEAPPAPTLYTLSVSVGGSASG